MDGADSPIGLSFFGRTIALRQGAITATGAAVIVNSTGSKASFRNPIAQDVLAAAGPDLRRAIKPYLPIPAGTVVVTGPGDLPQTRYIFHVVITSKAEGYRADPELILRVTARCIRLADLLDQPSIALPALGTGLGRARPEEAIKRMLNPIVELLPACEKLQTIIFAAKNPETVALFHNRALAILALTCREQELREALKDIPPELLGHVGRLLLGLEAARRADEDPGELLKQADGIVALGHELRDKLPQHSEAAQVVQYIINTGSNIVQNITQIAGSVHGPVLSGDFAGPVAVGADRPRA